MARSTTVTITDDIDGSGNAEAIEFSYKGTSYVIDLGKRNASAFDKALKPYLDAATKVSSTGRAAAAVGRGRKAVVSAGRKDVSKIRAWAAENGHTVNSRGRIPSDVLAAYEAAKK